MSRDSRARSLGNRVCQLATAVAAACLLGGALVWVLATRSAISEEVEAATRVAEHWLIATYDVDASKDARLDMLADVGRLRANHLEVFDADGRLRYRSPDATYQAGRDAPAWFAALLTPQLPARQWTEDDLTMRLQPEFSRSVLDAWDGMMFGAGWALVGVLLLTFAVRRATARIVAPLSAITDALRETANGNFNQRIGPLGSVEFDRLAEAYNQMAEHLDQTLARNAGLEADRAFERTLNHRLEQERRAIARDLHDEFAQGITAMRAIAGAISLRSADNAALHGSAQALMAMSAQVQDNVRAILCQLRRDAPEELGRLDETIARYATQWALCYPALCVTQTVDPLPDGLPEAFCRTTLRLLQEALTNVARHAGAHQVDIRLQRSANRIELCVRDDGHGFDPQAENNRYGLRGMRERVALWNGHWRVHCPAAGGCTITIALPLPGDTTTGHHDRNTCPEKHA